MTEREQKEKFIRDTAAAVIVARMRKNENASLSSIAKFKEKYAQNAVDIAEEIWSKTRILVNKWPT